MYVKDVKMFVNQQIVTYAMLCQLEKSQWKLIQRL